MPRAIEKGSADQSTVIRILDSTTFLPETAVEHNTAGIALWYRREGATQTAITEVALASLDAAHSDGGIEHIGDGYYRLDLPDAACLTGANGVMVGGTVTGMIVIGTYHHLVDYDPQDAVRLGLTALPNAAADAAGGLPISDAGGLDLDTKLANANEVTPARMGALTDLIDGGRLDVILDTVAANVAGLGGAAMRGTDNAATAGAQMDLVNAPNATAVTVIQAGLATPTNITAGTITTVTNLTNLPAVPNDWLTAAGIAADVGTEFAAAILGGEITELTSVPGASPSLKQAVALLYMALRNKRDTTSSTDTITNDAGTTIATASLSDNGTTFTKAEYL